MPVSFAYDLNGRRTRMTDGTGDTFYGYDSLNRLVFTQNPALMAVEYGYDLKGHLTRLFYPLTPGLGNTVTRSYDAAGRLASLTDPFGDITGFGYDPNGNLTSIAYPNTTTAGFSYDRADRQLSAGHAKAGSSFANFSYTRDSGGLVSSASSTGVGPASESYAYTALNQLSSVNSDPYAYDPADNITKMASAVLTYDDANQLKATNNAGAIDSFSFDKKGNRTEHRDSQFSGLSTKYRYDQANRLVEASPLSAGVLLSDSPGLISAGASHSLAVKFDGTVWAWGANTAGQLGTGTNLSSTTPALTVGVADAIGVAAGGSHSLAVTFDGLVFSWGDNSQGQLGRAGVATTTAGAVTGVTGAAAVAAGANHSLALKSDGTVVAWGDNAFGQLGNGSTTDSATPVAVSGLSGVTAIAAGANHSLALKSDGTVVAWGQNSSGQLGNGATTNSSMPVAVSGLSGVTSISGGGSHSTAARSDGTARAWGLNSSGQLGNGTTTNSSVPVTVSGIANASRVAAGGAHSLAVRTDGTVASWGDNDFGQLGNSLNADSSVPVAVSAFDQSTAVAAGGSHSVATRSDETIWAWGRGDSGQLGNESTQTSNSPVQAKGLLTLQAPATASYSYDGDGLRASKTVDGQASPFIWDVAQGLPMLLEDGVMRYIYGPGGIPVMQINLATQVPHYFHHDQLGSTRVLTNASGNTSATFTYDAYGALKTKTGSAVTALGFTGQYTDAETGFQYLRARYYDRQPVSLSQGTRCLRSPSSPTPHRLWLRPKRQPDLHRLPQHDHRQLFLRPGRPPAFRRTRQSRVFVRQFLLHSGLGRPGLLGLVDGGGPGF